MPGEARHDNCLKMKFLWCPAGTLVMKNRTGKEEVRLSVEPEKPDNDDVTVEDATEKRELVVVIDLEPVKAVLSAFWLGKHEVTRDEWQAIMHTEPWANRRVVVTGGDYPATYVSWDDATEFCKRLSDAERKFGRLPTEWEYILPTEAQWEFACRADSDTLFSFGDDESRLDRHAWIPANTLDRDEPYPHRVGRKRPNPWGFCDMHGNVSEWCRDWWGRFPGGHDPEIKVSMQGVLAMKAQRGGNFNSLAACCRSDSRDCAPPELKRIQFGFRVALSNVK
jgi:formylglycine-generating enzyme required for sulfatase activity